jgi:hypothetical protein
MPNNIRTNAMAKYFRAAIIKRLPTFNDGFIDTFYDVC